MLHAFNNVRSSLRSRIRDPLVFHRTLDRYVGYLHWDLRTGPSRIKLGAIAFTLLYYTVAVLSIPGIDPTEIPIDFYFGMWFLFGAGGSCFTSWLVLALERRDLRIVIQFLTDLQRHGADHPIRVRSRLSIVLFVILYWLQNVGQALYWAITLRHTSPIEHAAQLWAVKMFASSVYPLVVAMLGQMINITQVMTISSLLVFTVEFEILDDDLRKALDRWDLDRIRECIGRHQKLLEMVMLLRDRLKVYLLLNLIMYFFLITYACFIMVIQVKGSGGGSQSMVTSLNGLFSAICLILFGWICDRLEVKAVNIGHQLYNSPWPTNFIYRRERAQNYRLMRKNLLIVMMRSQHRIGFTCGSILNMSLETSYLMLRMCYSAFTLLLRLV